MRPASRTLSSARRTLAGIISLCLVMPWAAPAGANQTPSMSAALFVDVTETSLVGQPDEPKFSMAASAADLDGDGDLDLAIASEYAPNRVLINDGTGRMVDESAARLPRTVGDHEDVAIADYDGDGDQDLVFVGEDDQVYGYHLNDGTGRFDDVTDRLPSRGTSNAVVAVDVDQDGDQDLVVGNNGQDFVFVNDGAGMFSDETADRYPVSDDVTQDVEPGDIDGDGDTDLVLGNEDGNKVLINDGTGRFVDESEDRLPAPPRPEETRDADLTDVDGDGDLDLYLANTQLFNDAADAQDRLLLNEGSGTFRDVTAASIPAEQGATMTAAFFDADRDGDPDLMTGTLGDLGGETAIEPYRLFLNDGAGVFTEAPGALPGGVTGNGFDIEPADLDGDGFVDLFLASRGGTDRILQARP